MKLDSFIGIKQVGELAPLKFNSTIQWIIQWWNDHDTGARGWTNISISGSGNGLVVITPDGLHTYKIGVDNDGALTSTQIS